VGRRLRPDSESAHESAVESTACPHRWSS
jgi:hypothetical protein